MPDQGLSNHTVIFHSDAVGDGDLFVRSLSGREGVSQLYDFDIVVETTFGGALDQDQIDGILSRGAYFAYGGSEEHKFHGVIREVEMLSLADPTPVVYRLRMVPKLFDTTLTFGSWVYQDLSAPDLVKDVLKEAGWSDGDDYEFRVSGTYPKHEYKVQYQESDFNFISRILEHEGLFYFFEHGDSGAKLVVADGNTAFVAREGTETITYDPRQGVSTPTESVTSLNRLQRVITGKVTVRDYNYRTPSVKLLGESEVDAQGVGEQVYYGEHFKDNAQGKKVAFVRAQEHYAQREVYRGASAVRALRAGDRFTLDGHPLGALDQEYAVLAVHHEVVQTGMKDSAGGANDRAYSNEFTAIPYAVAFRPPQVTPKPRIAGVIHGKVDAPADGDRQVPVDEYGRYKVILPWDVGGAAGGKASRWIRMAQPASGPGYGVQFPLHIGTEVMIVHVDGDPDRPIIASSVPNHETQSPVNAGNASQSQMRSRHGITVTFDDQA